MTAYATRPIRRILTTTMFTAPSHVAVMYAARLASDLCATLTVLHVAPIPNEMIGIVPGASVSEEMDTLRASAEKRMSSVEAEVRGAGVTRVETIIEFSGTVARAIMARAVSSSCDLIVITTHGRGGVPRMILGSVADAVVREAACPVLTIRPY